MDEESPELGRPGCCQRLADYPAGILPFDRLVGLGFYDGITEVVARCFTYRREFLATCIDWNSDQSLRVFQLSSLTGGTLDQLVEIMSGHGTPTWPLWFPKLDPSDMDRVIGAVVESLRAHLAGAAFLVVTPAYFEHYYAYSPCEIDAPRELSIHCACWPPSGRWIERFGFPRDVPDEV